MNDGYAQALAEFLFIDHDGRTPVQLVMPEGIAPDTKRLFQCFLDVLLVGLVILYGAPDGTLPVHAITREQLDEARRRLACIGVACTVDVDGPFEDPPLTAADAVQKVVLWNMQPHNLPMDQYTYEVVSDNKLYRIRFELRAVPERDTCR
jgi:hypothetical protein